MTEAKGNMYEDVTHTLNVITGSCSHGCPYCYMNKILGTQHRPLKFSESAIKENKGAGNTIFVGSSTDMWAADVSSEWIQRVLDDCDQYPNKYLFQSKNPARFLEFINHPVMSKSILVTTLESNRCYDEMGRAPAVEDRASAMNQIAEHGIKTAVTIEPIMAFDMQPMIDLVVKCRPLKVYIGKNTNRSVQLTEPTPEAVLDLALALKRKGIDVKFKKNIHSYIRDEFNRRKQQKSQ